MTTPLLSEEKTLLLNQRTTSKDNNTNHGMSSSTTNNNSRLYIKRGSLTISNLPQTFNYPEDSTIAGTMPLITTELMERDSQEAYQKYQRRINSNGDVLLMNNQNNNNESSIASDNNNDEPSLLEDGFTPSVRQSSSSRASQALSWQNNNWSDTTCCFDFVDIRCPWMFHPQGPFSYFWLAIVSCAVLHNIIHIPLRFAFCGWNMNLGLAATTDDIIRGKNISSALRAIPATFPSRDIAFWMIPDYFCDLIYALDILKSMRTGFFNEEGFMNSHPQAIFAHYVGSASFYADILSLLPIDLLYLSFGLNSLLRIPRIIKIYRCVEFINWTERHTRWPNVARSVKMLAYVLLLSHWNAALCKSALHGYETIWFQKETMSETIKNQLTPDNNDFLSSATDLQFYWAWLYVSVSTLCTLGLSGTSKMDYHGPAFIFVFLTFQMMLGLVLFAVAIGEILLIVDSLGAGQREFQMHLDAVKNYMGKRNIPKTVRVKIIRWFDYIWESKRGFDEERRHLMVLPECLQADISLHAYLHTLKQVEFFRNTEAGFLKELVLKLKPVLFSPGEFVCRKGEIGRNMFIIELGRLHVFSGKHNVNTKPVAVLKKGQYFGELAILNMGKAGNRRTATIRSVGYSHLLSLCKDDLFAVLQDFPKERARLEYFASKRCEQYQQEKIQEKLKQQHSREAVNPVIVNENTEHDSQHSNSNNTTTASDPIGTMTTEQAPTPSSTPKSASNENIQHNNWQNGTVKEIDLKPTDFTRSECDLSILVAKKALCNSDGKNNGSLMFSSVPSPNIRFIPSHNYRMRQSNLVAVTKMNTVSCNASPLSKSMDLITGRESVL